MENIKTLQLSNNQQDPLTAYLEIIPTELADRLPALQSTSVPTSWLFLMYITCWASQSPESVTCSQKPPLLTQTGRQPASPSYKDFFLATYLWPLPSSPAWAFKLNSRAEIRSLEVPTPRGSDSGGLGQGLRIPFLKFPSESADLRTSVGDPWLYNYRMKPKCHWVQCSWG